MFKRAILILLLLASQSLAANKYVKSGAAGAANGSTWADAYTTLAAAFAGASAGDTIYVSDNHAETQASAMTLTSPGTAASPVRVLCGDDSAEPPTALATTATISTTGANAITFGNGCTYYYGIAFQAGDGTGATGMNVTGGGTVHNRFDTCILRLNGNATGYLLFGTSAPSGNVAQRTELINTTVNFVNVNNGIRVDSGWLIWRGGGTTGAATNTLFQVTGGVAGGTIELSGVDLSSCGAATGLVRNAAGSGPFTCRDSKLAASMVLDTGTATSQGCRPVRFINCDSGDTNYRYHLAYYTGTITHETTIVRTGGASDGTTSFSRKMVSSANSKYFSPLESDPIYFWNETTGSTVTVTVPVITDNVTLTNAEAWVEVDYLGTSGYPISSMTSDRSTDILASASNQTTDSTSTWTTTGLTTPVKQELSVTITPQEKGLIRARVMLAKASTTMYYDPKILTGSARQYMAGGALGVGNEGVSSGGGVSRARVVNPRD